MSTPEIVSIEITDSNPLSLKEINKGFDEFDDGEKKEESYFEETSASIIEVEELIKQGDYSGAQNKLDQISNRDAEWHYLQSVIFYKKNWLNESKKQLEIALNLEPHNQKYSNAYVKLKEKIEYNDKQFSGNAYGAYQSTDNRQMGGTDSNGCVDYCLTMCCMNMLCNMCCNCR